MRKLFVLALLLLAAPLAAQETISTDRPGLGFGTYVVQPGTVQWEIGVPDFQVNDDGGTSSRALDFATLLRIGVSDRFELRLGSPVYIFQHAESGGASRNTEGIADLELGAKVRVLDGGGAVPTVSLIPSAIFPTGSSRVGSSGSAAYTLNGVFGWDLPDGFGFTGVAGLNANPTPGSGGGTDYTTSSAFIGVLSRPFGERLSGHAEAAVYPTPSSPDPTYTGAGVLYLLSDNVQVDAFFDRGLGGGATDWLFGTGISFRY